MSQANRPEYSKDWELSEASLSLDLTVFGDEHVRLYRETDGAVGHSWNNLPCLVLTTTRRTTGEPRDSALLYGRDGDEYVVIASKGGHSEDPYWYRDLVAEPNVQVQVGAERFPAVAHTATAEERPHLWDVLNAIWPDFDSYIERAKPREIPLVRLVRTEVTGTRQPSDPA
jgi:deazaflavin-dependent oxidoreductase (nitroreductase family)